MMVRTKIRQRAVRLMREIDEPPGKAVELSVRNRRCFLSNVEIRISKFSNLKQLFKVLTPGGGDLEWTWVSPLW